jgi:transposase, IS5 family
MRKKIKQQVDIEYIERDRSIAKVITMIDQILNENPIIYKFVFEDIKGKKRTDIGAQGMTAEQVLRSALVKQIFQLSYRDLQFTLSDSLHLRTFCRIGDFEKSPSFTTLNENFKKLRSETMELVNRSLVRYAINKRIENGSMIRMDSTATETNIHYPMDNNLLWDCVRVITRLLRMVEENFPDHAWGFCDHTRRAKKRHFQIVNAKREEKRTRAYRDLISVSETTLGYARDAREGLSQLKAKEIFDEFLREALIKELSHYIPLMEQVIDQGKRRIINGEKVPSSQKVVSIFESHTDVIKKDNRATVFGHKVFLTGGKSKMIIDCVITRGNPSDTEMFPRLLDRSCERLGRTPKQTSTDGGFTSNENARYAREKGVKDVFFSKQRGNYLTQLIKSDYIMKKLRRFRAGIEGCISAAKRSLGLDRCNWSSFESFCSYVWLSIIGFNLKILANHLIC